ncbi:MAG TPA: sensor histidine kinase [Vicinamibacterales bacterium]|jgi:signal transduction histidine kinase
MNSLATFIRDNRQLILDEWLAGAQHLPSAHALPADTVRDHIPEFLDRLADAIDNDDVKALHLRGLPNLHAALRASEGYDLRQVVAEYRTLRTVIMRLYRERGDLSIESRPKLRPMTVMNTALDLAIADAVDQYALDQGRAREMFIGMLGHDLRDPLNGIVFGAEMLYQRGDEVDVLTRKISGRIAASAKRMEGMIRDLLDFARGRLGGGFPIVPAPLDARTLIADTVSEIGQAHPDRSIECVPGTPGDFCVYWDSDRIVQAIANLVSNAVVHGSDPVEVEPKDGDEWITIEVRNRGEIAPALMPNLFAPFAQPGADRRHDGLNFGPERRRGHLGLGLYIVREIASAHGGRVIADSKDGVTTFTMVLPRNVPAPESAIPT